MLAKAHQEVKRQRRDFHHKTALALVRANDTIYHEDLQVRNMVKNHRLAKSIQDAGWSAFLTILAYTAACASRQVIVVNLRSPASGVLTAASWPPRLYPSVGAPARTVARACIGTITPRRI
jgi:putative transposase